MPVSEEIEKTPTGDTAVNKPESGTYGEKAELNQLKQSLPPMDGQGQQPQGPAPMGERGGATPPKPTGRPVKGPSNLPSGILQPTGGNPNRPLTGAPEMPPRQSTADQQRLAILDALSTHPDVSQETRKWAEEVKDYLISGNR